jgi:hypothetical protein
MIEDCISMGCLEEFKEEYGRLRLLVWELLMKNQELRVQLAITQNSREIHPP